jgi:3-hydroxyisobutyrate dehydrogenase
VASHDLASIYDGSYDPSFSIRLCCKDLRFNNELAAQLDVPIEMGLWLSRFPEEQAMSTAKMSQIYP